MTYACNTSVKTERQTKATAAANSVFELGTTASENAKPVRFVTKPFLSSVQSDRNNNNNNNNNNISYRLQHSLEWIML